MGRGGRAWRKWKGLEWGGLLGPTSMGEFSLGRQEGMEAGSDGLEHVGDVGRRSEWVGVGMAEQEVGTGAGL